MPLSASWSLGTSLISAKDALSVGFKHSLGLSFAFTEQPFSASCAQPYAQVPGFPCHEPQKGRVRAGWVLGTHPSQWPWLGASPSAKASFDSTTQTSGT